MLESIFMTAALEAKERRDMAVTDLPEAFLNAKIDDDVIMTITGKLAELMVMVVPQIYCKYITTNKRGDPLPYMKVQKAIYGMLKSTLWFYKNYHKTWKHMCLQ